MEEDLAYAAGIIDGEGSIGVHRNGQNQLGYRYVLCIQVSMTNPIVPNWLREMFGGHTGTYKQSKQAFGTKPVTKWFLYGIDALEFLYYIIPYLMEKREQAEIALVFPVGTKGNAETEIQGHIYTLLKKQ